MSPIEWTTPNVQVDAALDDEQFWSSEANAGFDSSVDIAQADYQRARRLHWNNVARKLETSAGWGGCYHRRLTRVYQSLVSPGQSVIELGCARGDLLAALKPGK